MYHRWSRTKKGNDRYLFDTYYRGVDESSQKKLAISGQRSLSSSQFVAYENNLKALSRNLGGRAWESAGVGRRVVGFAGWPLCRV